MWNLISIVKLQKNVLFCGCSYTCFVILVLYELRVKFGSLKCFKNAGFRIFKKCGWLMSQCAICGGKWKQTSDFVMIMMVAIRFDDLWQDELCISIADVWRRLENSRWPHTNEHEKFKIRVPAYFIWLFRLFGRWCYDRLVKQIRTNCILRPKKVLRQNSQSGRSLKTSKSILSDFPNSAQHSLKIHSLTHIFICSKTVRCARKSRAQRTKSTSKTSIIPHASSWWLDMDVRKDIFCRWRC